MKNLIQTIFLLLFASICVNTNANTVAPSSTKSDTIKPRKGIVRQPQMPTTPVPSAEMDKSDQKPSSAIKQVGQKETLKIQEISKTASDTISPKAAKKAAAAAKKAAEKAAAEAKKAEEKRLQDEKDKLKPPRIHLFAWLSLGLGIIAIAGLIGYFVMPVLGLGAIAAIGAGIFGYLGSKKIKKEPLKWKGLPFTTFGGMSILALLGVIVVALVSFFRTNSGI